MVTQNKARTCEEKMPKKTIKFAAAIGVNKSLKQIKLPFFLCEKILEKVISNNALFFSFFSVVVLNLQAFLPISTF